MALAKPELGTKRVCQSCGARFYDLGRDPAPCPKCGFENSLEALLRAKRSRSAPPEPKARPPKRPAVSDDTGDEDIALDVDEEEEEGEPLEDASELGEDDDVSDVIENSDEDNEDR